MDARNGIADALARRDARRGHDKYGELCSSQPFFPSLSTPLAKRKQSTPTGTPQ
jgi:hypothetical protein